MTTVESKITVPRPMSFPDHNALSYTIQHAKDTGDDPEYVRHLEKLLARGQAFGGHGTHVPVLAALAAVAPPGDFLELGAGQFSTLVLDEVARASNRKMWTLESDANWLTCFDDLKSDFHQFVHVKAWKDWPTTIHSAAQGSSTFGSREDRWSIAFVDHAGGSGRADMVAFLADKATFIVAHDSNNNFFTGLDDTLAQFKYIADYLPICPITTIVSNYKPIPVGTPR